MIPLCRAGFCVCALFSLLKKNKTYLILILQCGGSDRGPVMLMHKHRVELYYICKATMLEMTQILNQKTFFSLLHGLFWLSSPFKFSLCACQQHHPLAIMWITLWAKKKGEKNRMLLFVFLPGEGSHEPWMCRAELMRRRTSIFDWARATFHLK